MSRETESRQIGPLELSYWSSQQQNWVLPGGERTFYVGSIFEGHPSLGPGSDRLTGEIMSIGSQI